MGSVQTFDNKCPYCGKHTLVSDYYYNTNEDYLFCESCCYKQSIFLKRDANHNLVREIAGRYLIDGKLCIFVKNLYTNEVIDKYPIRPDMTPEEIYDKLNQKGAGFCGIYHEDDLSKLLFHHLSDCQIEKSETGQSFLVVRDIIYQIRYRNMRKDGTKILIEPIKEEDRLRFGELFEKMPNAVVDEDYIVHQITPSGDNAYLLKRDTLEKIGVNAVFNGTRSL